MKRAAWLITVFVVHAVVVDIALSIHYTFWGTSLSVAAGKVQRLVDMPVLRVCRLILNRAEFPVWWATRRINRVAVVNEIVVFDLIGGGLYGLIAFAAVSIKWRRKVDGSMD